MVIEPEQNKNQSGVSGLGIPAGLLIGMGVGYLTDELTAGLFIGLGAGFLVMMVARAILGEW